MTRERPGWLDPRSQIPTNSAAHKFIMWFTTPFRRFGQKPHPVAIGVLTLANAAFVVFALYTGHSVRVSSIVFMPFGARLTYRQYKARQQYPDGYPWAKAPTT